MSHFGSMSLKGKTQTHDLLYSMSCLFLTDHFVTNWVWPECHKQKKVKVKNKETNSNFMRLVYLQLGALIWLLDQPVAVLIGQRTSKLSSLASNTHHGTVEYLRLKINDFFAHLHDIHITISLFLLTASATTNGFNFNFQDFPLYMQNWSLNPLERWMVVKRVLNYHYHYIQKYNKKNQNPLLLHKGFAI